MIDADGTKSQNNNNNNNNDNNNNPIQQTTTPDSVDGLCSVQSDDDIFLEDFDNEKKKEDNENESDEELARKETVAIFRLRVLVIAVLLLATVAVSLVVYYITRTAENEEAKTLFDGTADKVIESFDGVMKQKLGAISNIAVAMMAHAIDHIREWPATTLSSFQERSTAVRRQSGVLFVEFMPVVTNETRLGWEEYALEDEDSWMNKSISYQSSLEVLGIEDPPYLPRSEREMNPVGRIFHLDEDENPVVEPEDERALFLPAWEHSPALKGRVNRNVLGDPKLADLALKCLETGEVIVGGIIVAPRGDYMHPDRHTSFYAALLSIREKRNVEYEGDPMSVVFFPIFNSFGTVRQTVALMKAQINWATYFQNLLPSTINGVVVVLGNECDGAFTYEINGQEVTFLGAGDRHDERYDRLKRSKSQENSAYIADGTEFGMQLNQGSCQYWIDVYPSRKFMDQHKTKTPVTITTAVALVFVFASFMFFVYDRLVERRQELIMKTAAKSSAILSSLFPKMVKDRLLQDEEAEKKQRYIAPNHRLKTFLSGDVGDEANERANADPIADLFPHATVLFADIAGFTAWSSSRDPSHVFILLQNLYGAFDEIAKRRKVWKVETIGDSYVAVTGCPQPQEAHAVIMARFAYDCRNKLKEVTSDLEVTLGPDTGNLAMRFGMHSGPVTAGVIRGDRSRFQLFGDTVNTAARMESLGQRGRIQVSEETAKLLRLSGKDHWLTPREDTIQAKGKGTLSTYWIEPSTKKLSTTSSTTSPSSLGDDDMVEDSKVRLIDWMVELFTKYLKDVLVNRAATEAKGAKPRLSKSDTATLIAGPGTVSATALDEVAEVIHLPRFDVKKAVGTVKSVDVDDAVLEQIRAYITIIAHTYHTENPFHNWEHACHVTLAVNKFLQRIVAPDISLDELKNSRYEQMAQSLHTYTHGITSDPLTVMAILFSAIIHDADHRGVSNAQLAKEEETMARKFKNKCIAEQNSLGVAWDLLMTEQFVDLRGALFVNDDDLSRFRQVMVNVVLATDIFDRELNDLRKNRWAKAFPKPGSKTDDVELDDLRATVVFEHIIQASDVSHTMQHWHVYRKWNERLFAEMSLAHQSGRMASDPTEFWYKSEIGFFDNYVIPLAKKLKECNVFGVSSDECLNYALKNRDEWTARGQQIVAEMATRLGKVDNNDGLGQFSRGDSFEDEMSSHHEV